MISSRPWNELMEKSWACFLPPKLFFEKNHLSLGMVKISSGLWPNKHTNWRHLSQGSSAEAEIPLRGV